MQTETNRHNERPLRIPTSLGGEGLGFSTYHMCTREEERYLSRSLSLSLSRYEEADKSPSIQPDERKMYKRSAASLLTRFFSHNTLASVYNGQTSCYSPAVMRICM